MKKYEYNLNHSIYIYKCVYVCVCVCMGSSLINTEIFNHNFSVLAFHSKTSFTCDGDIVESLQSQFLRVGRGNYLCSLCRYRLFMKLKQTNDSSPSHQNQAVVTVSSLSFLMWKFTIPLTRFFKKNQVSGVLFMSDLVMLYTKWNI